MTIQPVKEKTMKKDYHVTAIRNGGVYGHSDVHCDESGCNGLERFIGDLAAAGIEPQIGLTYEFDEAGQINGGV